MPLFKYTAIDATGHSVDGELEAVDAAQASAQLAQQGLVSILIERDESQVVSQPPVLAVARPAQGEPVYLQRITRALAQQDELLPVLDAIAAEPASYGLKRYLTQLSRRLRSGVTAQEFVHNERLAIWLPIVLSGSDAGRMNERYSQWLRQVSDERTRWRSIWSTLTYPLVLLICVLCVLLPIAIFIVPTFQRMFLEFGLTLPGLTRLVISMSELVNHRPHYLILGVLILVGLGVLVTRFWLKHSLATRFFGFVVAGNTIGIVAMSRLTTALAELLEAGAPLADALVLSGVASRHAHYRQAAKQLASQLSSSQLSNSQLANPQLLPIHAPAAQTFPETLIYALTAGPGNQPSIPLIRELAQMYSSRVRGRLNRRSGFTSPLLVVAVGILVGMIVLALLMPLFQMISSLA